MECTRGKLRTCEPHPVPVRAVGEAQGGAADCVEGPRSCRGDARPPTVSSEHRPDEDQQTDGDCTTTNTHRAPKYAPQWTLLRQTCPSSPWPFASHIQTFVKPAATNWSLVPCPGPSGPFQRPFSAPREGQSGEPPPASPASIPRPWHPLSPALFPSSLQHQQPNSGRLFAIQALRCATPHHALLCEAAAILHPASFQFARRKP